jgi:AcrR family transcriptional regulator
MKSNDNSVNIKLPKNTYHHGDLRAAVIAEGLMRLKSGVLDDVSLRELARNVGVSATALYRHFPDKNALMSALAGAGADMFGAEQRRAFAQAGGGQSGFNATGRAYVRFALANPALFRLMMSCKDRQATSPGKGAQINSALSLLHENIAAIFPQSASDDQRRVGALQAWALVHGLAMLMLEGQVPADDSLIDLVIDASKLGAL